MVRIFLPFFCFVKRWILIYGCKVDISPAERFLAFLACAEPIESGYFLDRINNTCYSVDFFLDFSGCRLKFIQSDFLLGNNKIVFGCSSKCSTTVALFLS